MELHVKNFGAVGDGKTDDAKAIFKAVFALRASPAGSVLHFEAGKTYYYKDNGTKDIKAVFRLQNDAGLTIRGNNCLIKLGGYESYYAEIKNCEDITMEGLRLDYAEYKPAFAATLDSIDIGTGIAVLTADRPVNLETGETYVSKGRNLFATIPFPHSRYYLWIIKYEMLDAAARKVRVTFDPGRGNYDVLNDQACVNQYGLVMPMPKTGNETGYSSPFAFWIQENRNITFRHMKVYSAGLFGMYFRENEGTVLIENVRFERAPYDQNLKFTSWGDSWHPNNNRAKFILKNCKSEYAYDDVFNFNTTTMFVAQKHSDTEITLKTRNNWTGIPKVWLGDTITIVNQNTGALIGRPTVESVAEQGTHTVRVVLSAALPLLKAGEEIFAWDDNMANHAESEIINGDLDGTFRARTHMTFTDCRLNVRRFWIGLECPVEGSLPRNLLFKNCDLTGDDGQVWEIRSYNDQKGGYHAENIVFENCKGIDMDHVRKDPYDEVIIR